MLYSYVILITNLLCFYKIKVFSYCLSGKNDQWFSLVNIHAQARW